MARDEKQIPLCVRDDRRERGPIRKKRGENEETDLKIGHYMKISYKKKKKARCRGAAIDARDFARLNRAAPRLNVEAGDVLEYQRMPRRLSGARRRR